MSGKKKQKNKPKPSEKVTKSTTLQQPVDELSFEVSLNENESGLTTFWIQTWCLVWKNMLIFRRKLGVFFFMLMTPIVVGILMNVMVGIGTTINTQGSAHEPIHTIGKAPLCGESRNFDPSRDEPCISVGYGFIGTQTNTKAPELQKYHELMEIFADLNDFELGKDVKQLTVGGQQEIFDYV